MTPEQLEKTVHAALRALPARRAPATLEARVLAEIPRRAAIPWWHKSYAHWPLGARAAFLVLTGGAALLVALAAIYIQAGSGVAQVAVLPGPWADIAGRAVGLCHGVFDIGALIVRNIPPLWVHGAVAFIAGLYAALFGLSAAAYRVLWTHR